MPMATIRFNGPVTVVYNGETIHFDGPITITDEDHNTAYWTHQIGENDAEPCKEEPPDEPIERCYPIRHEDEILRIIMRQEVWRPP